MPSWRVAIAFVVLLIVVLVVCGIVLRMAGQLVEKTGMSGTDRSLGIVFGVLRGIAIMRDFWCCSPGLTSVPRDSMVEPVAVPATLRGTRAGSPRLLSSRGHPAGVQLRARARTRSCARNRGSMPKSES